LTTIPKAVFHLRLFSLFPGFVKFKIINSGGPTSAHSLPGTLRWLLD